MNSFLIALNHVISMRLNCVVYCIEVSLYIEKFHTQDESRFVLYLSTPFEEKRSLEADEFEIQN